MNGLKKTVGILGGMGPYATSMFYNNIIEMMPVEKDRDHLRIIVDSNPHIPSRSRAILYEEDSPVEAMVESCRRLSAYPVDFIAVASNNACYFLPEVQKAVKVPILNIFDIASGAMYQKNKMAENIAVIGGAVTYMKETYKKSLLRKGLKLIKHDKEVQEKIEELIKGVKQNKNKVVLKDLYLEIVNTIKENSPDGIILACTELSVFRDLDVGVPVVDSNYALADYTVKAASGIVELPFDTDAVLNFWKGRASLLDKGSVSEFQATMFVGNKEKAREKDRLEKERVLTAVDVFKDFGVDRALDIGCGVGRWAELFSDYFKHVDAVDYCEGFIDTAKANAEKKNLKNINYYVGSVEDIDEKNKYDCVFSFGLFNYLGDNAVRKLAESIGGVLRPGGKCVLRETIAVKKRVELHGFYSESLKTNYSSIYRTIEEINTVLKKHGIEMISKEVYTHPTEEKPETCQMIIIYGKES